MPGFSLFRHFNSLTTKELVIDDISLGGLLARLWGFCAKQVKKWAQVAHCRDGTSGPALDTLERRCLLSENPYDLYFTKTYGTYEGNGVSVDIDFANITGLLPSIIVFESDLASPRFLP